MCPRTAICVIHDSVGVGELNDAALLNDQESDTLGNLARAVGDLFVPNFKRLGRGAISSISVVRHIPDIEECYANLAECSQGKDGTTSHREVVGLIR